MNTQGLIAALVQRTTVFIGQLATAGGVRLPLIGIADQVFLARRVRELRSMRTELGHTLWEAMLAVAQRQESACERTTKQSERTTKQSERTNELRSKAGELRSRIS